MPTFEVEIGADYGAQAIITDGVGRGARGQEAPHADRPATVPALPGIGALAGLRRRSDGGIIATDGLGGLPGAGHGD